MTAKDVLKFNLVSTRDMLGWYLSDMSDEELKQRPTPKANNIAWQLGHLINSEVHLGSAIPGAHYPELPASIKGQYDNNASASGPAAGYQNKATYLEWFNKVRNATLDCLERIPDAELDKPTSGNMAKFAPTIGALFILTSQHILMHAGQFSVVRRALGKPVLF